MKDCPGGDIIMVSEGYWRINNQTDDIYFCYNKPSNCLGGNLNEICSSGYIGPLCESCDLYGENGI